MLPGILIAQRLSRKIYREAPITLSGLIFVPIMFHELCRCWPFLQNMYGLCEISQNVSFVKFNPREISPI